MNTIFSDKLKELGACTEAFEWVLKQPEVTYPDLLEKGIKEGHIAWARWLLVRIMSQEQKIKYIQFVTQQVCKTSVLDTEVYNIAKNAKTADEWGKTAVGYADKAIKGYIDSDYMEDAYETALYASELKEEGSGKKLKLKALEYGISLLREKDGK